MKNAMNEVWFFKLIGTSGGKQTKTLNVLTSTDSSSYIYFSESRMWMNHTFWEVIRHFNCKYIVSGYWGWIRIVKGMTCGWADGSGKWTQGVAATVALRNHWDSFNRRDDDSCIDFWVRTQDSVSCVSVRVCKEEKEGECTNVFSILLEK